ncbi:sulfatase [Microlunatus soli]|uniref:Arylsulfatase A n=1 Tax=Microlunatus soli TaxID=630515 RepID=A0A1H2AIX6_9ACTN|nr:sulfatase [Microlunatus soli]SDT45819.1 Arylsulfatase A [Microlunatus soli]
MKAIMVMFDTLNKRFLPPYGNDWVHAPNFRRLAERTATFDTCYAGSMPCMPARREIHTGRHNFLHRGWGPLEPFDDSMPELLQDNGIYTHLVTDHQHYWEDGGATYHNRYCSYEFFRGQEGDAWKGHVADPEDAPNLKAMRSPMYRQDVINRQYLSEVDDHPQTKTFDAGLHFLRTNHDQDNWFVQIETFDPHEPFYSYEQHKKHYPHDYDGPDFDWPDYKQVLESDGEVEHLRYEYASLLSMCDESLGRVLDTMDDLDLWDDTMLIVCTDHGFLLGEHGWWGKNVQPWYDETIHTPLFIWDPRSRVQGERRGSLVQTIDFAPTLLDYFGLEPTPDMLGRSLRQTIADDEPVREAGLFGAFGGHVSVTDGRYVYMRAPHTPENRPLAEHTLMPTHMRGRFTPAELRGAELAGPFGFTKGVPVLKVDGQAMTSPYAFGTLLFDLQTDPEQQHPMIDDQLELRMIEAMLDLFRVNEAPPEQYERLGLPQSGPATRDHLQIRVQWPQVESSRQGPPKRSDYPQGRLSVHTPLKDLRADPQAKIIIDRHLPQTDGVLSQVAADLSMIEIAAFAVGLLPLATLRTISDELSVLAGSSTE